MQGLYQAKVCKADCDVRLAAAKFNPIKYIVFNVAKISFFMILIDFRMLPAQFCDEVMKIRNLESHMQIVDRCAHWDSCQSSEELCFASTALKKDSVCRNIQSGLAEVILDLMSVL